MNKNWIVMGQGKGRRNVNMIIQMKIIDQSHLQTGCQYVKYNTS